MATTQFFDELFESEPEEERTRSTEEQACHEYWKVHFVELDACKTQAEADALRNIKFCEMEKRLYSLN